MPATYSNENLIEQGLRSLACTHQNFVEIAKQRGVKIPRGPFSEQLRTQFTPGVAEQLLAVLEEMRDLYDQLPVPPDWSNTERIATVLLYRLIAKQGAQFRDHNFEAVADEATKQLVKP